MRKALTIRRDRTAEQLRQAASREASPRLVKRLRAIAAILDGASRSEAARREGVTLQTLRRWVVRYNNRDIAGLIDRRRRGANLRRPPVVRDTAFEPDGLRPAPAGQWGQ